MKVFNAKHFLRHIGMPTLQQFTQHHVLGKHLCIDWSASLDALPGLLCDAVESLEQTARSKDTEERQRLEQDLMLWFDDLRRAHMMCNELGMSEFRDACAQDPEALEAFAQRDEQEIALWMLTYRDKAFRDVELHMAFQARTNGKFWKKHRIQRGLTISQDRKQLERFCQAVAQLYRKSGAGEGVHVELSQRSSWADPDGSIQLTIYVEGPLTSVAHFMQSNFTRLTTRIALETALVYRPATGEVETIVKGGARNHAAVLALFGEHIAQQPIAPERIEPQHYQLNTLRDGMQPLQDWASLGVEKIRLRRAQFRPLNIDAVSVMFEASPQKDQVDAVALARERLKVKRSFETEYALLAATVVVYKISGENSKSAHFSFDVEARGTSTIKNLSPQNQTLAHKVLQALMVIDPDGEAHLPWAA